MEGTKKLKCVDIVKSNLLVILTLVGAGVGFGIGFGIRPYSPSDSVLMWIGIVGELYLRILKMMIVPLIVCSVIAGTATMDPKSNGKISAVSLSYIMLTNFLGALTGCLVCVIIQPGVGLSAENGIKKSDSVTMETQDIFADLFRNLLPDNLVQAAFEQAQTQYSVKRIEKNITANETSIESVITKENGYARSTNILGLIIASALFGIATSAKKEIGEPFRLFFTSATEVILQILQWVIWSTPVGVSSLIAKTIAKTENIEGDLQKLAVYTGALVLGLCIVGFIMVSIVYLIIKRQNPFRFLFSILEGMMIVFATSSTAIAIPESLKRLEGPYNNIDKRITRFLVPFSATLGRCGSSVYIAASCIFIMQMVEMGTDAGNIVLVCILTTFSSLAIPSVSGASLITVIILLTALGIPAEAAGLLYALEWLLDRLRSIANYCVQCLGSVLTQRTCHLSSNENEPKDLGNIDGEISCDVSEGTSENILDGKISHNNTKDIKPLVASL